MRCSTRSCPPIVRADLEGISPSTSTTMGTVELASVSPAIGSLGLDGAAEQRAAGPVDLVGVRILVIMPSVPVQGMERSNLQIMKMVRERGADVLFITERTYGGKIRREVEWIGCSWTTATFITSFEERLHLTKNPREIAAVLKAWGRAAWEIDRIYKEYRPTHIYLTNLDCFLYGLPTMLRAKEPVILRLPNPPAKELPRAKQRLYNWIWRYVLKPACNVIVCNCQYTVKQLEKAGVRAEKRKVIYNCLPERECTDTSDAPKVNSGQFNIVYLGRIRPGKGVKELYEVALGIICERDDVDFYFAGEYDWLNPFAESLIREVRGMGLGKRLQFIGEIQDVFGLLSQCDLHVCPSTSPGESFPNVLLEAKSQGLPSVVFPTAGIPEAMNHRVDGYICRDKSAQALYEGIRYFLDNPAALKAAGEAAKGSLKHFSRERISDQWAEVFKKA